MGAIGVLRTIEGGRLGFWCPGCEEMHVVLVRPPGEDVWGWNSNYERPTFTPSVLVRSGHYLYGTKWLPNKVSGKDPCWCTWNRDHPGERAPFECSVCHSFVNDGSIQFLGDCTHKLRGQTVRLTRHLWEVEDMQLRQETEGQENAGAEPAKDEQAPPPGNDGSVKEPPPNPGEEFQKKAELAQSTTQPTVALTTQDATAVAPLFVYGDKSREVLRVTEDAVYWEGRKLEGTAMIVEAMCDLTNTAEKVGAALKPEVAAARSSLTSQAGSLIDRIREGLHRFENHVALEEHALAGEVYAEIRDALDEIRGHVHLS